MNYEMIILRLLHIVFGMFWAGSAVFFALILQPKLAKLGPEIQGPVMAAIIPLVTRTVLVSAFITIAAGITLALRLRWGNLDAFYNTGWGIAIMIGFVAGMGAISSGITQTVLAHRMIALNKNIRGRGPTSEEASELQRLSGRLPRVVRTTAVLVVFAVGAMASARFV